VKTEQFVERLEGVRAAPGGFLGRCPAHDDREASLSVKDDEDKILIHCHAGCLTSDVLAEMGLQWTDLWHDAQTNGQSFSSAKPEATYIYDDETGRELYRVIRYPGKRFRHERKTVPYRLLAVIGAVKEGRTVYIVEGEKDVHALERAGRIATCNAGGAGSWKPEYEKYFKGAKVIVVADNDEPGIRHAKDVAAMLYSVVSRLWIVQPRSGKDVSDHLGEGMSVEALTILEQVR